MTTEAQVPETTAPATEAAPIAVSLPGIPEATPVNSASDAPPAAAPVADDDSVVTAAGFETTDDPGLNLAIKFVAARGIKADDPAIQAVRNGDFSLIKARLSSLGDKAAGWQEHIALAEKAYQSAVERSQKSYAETEQAVYSVVGGPENWADIAEWAGKTATQQEKDAINAALAAGGIQAKAAASYLLNVYQKAGQVVSKTPVPAAKENAAPAGPGAGNALTAKEYANAVAELSVKYGGRDVTGTTEYAQLQAARLAGKRRGL